MSKTIGEQRVRVDFNVAKDEATRSNIDLIKTKTAELINILNLVKDEALRSERNRLIALAQTDYESAAMWAVKAITATD